jgi:hypothetical protein
MFGRYKPGETTMAQKSLEERVDMLERRIELLEQLPERLTALEVQIVYIRDEMRAEFSATRAEGRAGDEHVVWTLREEIRAGDEETRRQLRDEIRGGDEETRRFMRILHEEVIERIKELGGQP